MLVFPLKTLKNNLAEALSALHAFTGCDSTSAFVQKGKNGL